MSVAAVSLALALLVAPGTPRRRLTQRRIAGAVPDSALMLVGVMAAVVLVFAVPVTVVLAVAILASTLVVRRRRAVRSSRRAEESAALQGALSVLVGELGVGAHPIAAFETAASEVDGAVAGQLSAVAARARLGADVAAGLRAVAVQSMLPAQWERLSVCWQLAQTHGLAIATLMRTAHRDVVERDRYASRVTAGMAGARATALILAGLPLLGVGLGELIGAGPVRFLFSDGPGGWLLVVGVALACCGLAWSDRITNRVLA
ncbi:type II secretion system F family protein [Mycobacterium sp. URHB0044]|uniref:type II secretion system F family protein n=1 Tax=Mycobacterium sp. URHB0044 TaxID=1380386 RepID=UPI00048CD62D|nr:membrane protein [Mycobacterium sp. URHB0044]